MRTLHSVLVTGGAGFVGSAFVRRVLAARPDVHVVTLDALTYAGSLDNLADLPDAERHVFVHGDVRDTALVADLVDTHHVDTVVHFAAESHVDRSIEGPMAFLRTNVEGTASVLQGSWSAWSRRTWSDAGPRFHQVSTDEVFGDLAGTDHRASEDDPYRPSSPYAASKAAADHLVRAWRRTWGVPVTITHATNTYGPRQYPEKLLPVVVERALAGAPIPVYGDGRQVRDWLHVDDHVDGVLAVIERGEEGQAYNLAGGDVVENGDLVRRVCGILDALAPEGAPHRRLIASVPDRLGHDRRYAVDDARARALGWSPRHTLAQALPEVIAWYVARARS